MNQEHVDVIDIEPAQTFINCRQGAIVALILVPDFGGDKEFFAGKSRSSNPGAYL